MLGQVLPFKPVGFGVILGDIAVHGLPVGIVICEGGMDLADGEVPNSQCDLFGQ